ncbi:Uma2 family endonuclease [Aciduricibacillus chroicocephali]|uniref:Uma2 family endonuclease n=1 Tax=Aciduricibacillus chroicocephali TaxID=3054939 RepID=A0ABY9KTG5_9BACI|nr:Uma2 family endonuclease [Bacillaceae bacterium 44XB]
MTNRQISERVQSKTNSHTRLQTPEALVGELMRTPAPPPSHQLIVQKILRLLYTAIGETHVILQAPCDLQLTMNKFRQPDLMVISRHRKDIIAEHAVIGPPDAVIEVLSPSSRPLDCREKIKDYAAFGIKEYWIADPDQYTLLQYILPAGGIQYIRAAAYQGHDSVHFHQSADKLFVADDLWSGF